MAKFYQFIFEDHKEFSNFRSSFGPSLYYFDHRDEKVIDGWDFEYVPSTRGNQIYGYYIPISDDVFGHGVMYLSKDSKRSPVEKAFSNYGFPAGKPHVRMTFEQAMSLYEAERIGKRVPPSKRKTRFLDSYSTTNVEIPSTEKLSALITKECKRFSAR